MIYAFSLALSVLFYALYPYWFSWYLMVLILMMIPFDLVFSLPGMITKRVSLIAPGVLEQGADDVIEIVTHQKRPFPAGWVKTNISVTGDDFRSRKRILCSPARGSRYKIAIDSSHSGVTVYEIKRIRTTSLLGLFTISPAVNLRAKVLILPKPLRPPRIISLPRGVILHPKPGGGFSEDNDLRPYRPGDPIKVIHWKLSAKLDSLIVREPLYPPSLNRLVHVVEWQEARERDIILGRLRWVAAYLLRWELSFCVKLGDDGPVAEITSGEEFFECLCGLLDGTARSRHEYVALPERFSWVFRIDAVEAYEPGTMDPDPSGGDDGDEGMRMLS